MRMEQENDRVKLIRLWREGEPLDERVPKLKARPARQPPLNGRLARCEPRGVGVSREA